jgi:hypothetical protein
LPKLVLHRESSYKCLLSSWHYRYAPPCWACFLRQGLANLLPGLASKAPSQIAGLTGVSLHTLFVNFKICFIYQLDHKLPHSRYFTSYISFCSSTEPNLVFYTNLIHI